MMKRVCLSAVRAIDLLRTPAFLATTKSSKPGTGIARQVPLDLMNLVAAVLTHPDK